MQIRLLLWELLLAHLHSPCMVLLRFHLFIDCLLTLKTSLAHQVSSFLQLDGVHGVVTRCRFSTLEFSRFFATELIWVGGTSLFQLGLIGCLMQRMILRSHCVSKGAIYGIWWFSSNRWLLRVCVGNLQNRYAHRKHWLGCGRFRLFRFKTHFLILIFVILI